MNIPSPSFEEHDYTQDKLAELVRAFSGYKYVPTQVQYLQRYLECLGARKILHESHYVDRDYIEDFSEFYSRSFQPRKNYCERLHFFKEGDSTIEASVKRVANGDASPEEIEADLSARYLGFVVVRPLEGCPIGRTVLRPKGDDPHRHITVIRPYVAHVLGLALKVDSLAFQQQDRAVSACATTALWSAAQKASHQDEMTIATPAQITRCAGGAGLPIGRLIPNEGLTPAQMCLAIAELGLSPLLRSNRDDPIRFRLQMMAYLDSGIPVIAIMKPPGGGEGHAVTVAGYRTDPSVPDLIGGPSGQFRHFSARVSHVYVHDDRLGPFAKAELGIAQGQLQAVIEMPDRSKEIWDIPMFIAPLYPKVRLTAGDMLAEAYISAMLLAHYKGTSTSDVELDVRIVRGHEYSRDVLVNSSSPQDAWGLLSTKGFPRYVGLIRAGTGGKWYFDQVLDTTATVLDDAVLTVRFMHPLSELPTDSSGASQSTP